jgi:phosphomannomutase
MKRDEQTVFAGEHSAHYFFRDNFCIDSGILVGMLILDMMKTEGKKLSELTKEYKHYITLEETNFRVNNPKEVESALRDAFHDEEQDTLD